MSSNDIIAIFLAGIFVVLFSITVVIYFIIRNYRKNEMKLCKAQQSSVISNSFSQKSGISGQNDQSFLISSQNSNQGQDTSFFKNENHKQFKSVLQGEDHMGMNSLFNTEDIDENFNENLIDDINGNNYQSEITAVISAVIAYYGDSFKDTNLKFKSIKRTMQTSPVWNLAGRNEYISGKL